MQQRGIPKKEARALLMYAFAINDFVHHSLNHNFKDFTQKLKMQKALKILTQKKLGTLVVRNNRGITTGIITDGTIRRLNHSIDNLKELTVKAVMTKKPICIDKGILAEKALAIMNYKKITCLCVNSSKNKTVGILHIHNILESKIQ